MAVSQRFFDRAFGRYALTSALATGTDFVLANLLHASGLRPGSATFLGCVAGGVVAFWLGRRWTFAASAGRALPQLLRFLGVWAVSALLNSALVPLLLGVLPSFPLCWLLVRGGVYLGVNYPLARWFVFTPSQAPVGLSAR